MKIICANVELFSEHFIDTLMQTFSIHNSKNQKISNIEKIKTDAFSLYPLVETILSASQLYATQKYSSET